MLLHHCSSRTRQLVLVAAVLLGARLALADEIAAPLPPEDANLPPRLLAILPFVDNNDEARRMDPATKITLEENIRTASGDVLGPWNYTILTSDNMLSILADNGIDPSKACEASCSLQAARELKADIFVSGSVALTEGSYTAILRLFEAKNGRQLGSVVLEGYTVREIRQTYARKVVGFFKQLLVVPAQKVGPPRNAEVTPPPPSQPPAPVIRPAPLPAPVASSETKPAPATNALPPAALAPPPAPAKPMSAGKGVGIAAAVVGGLGLAAGTAFGVLSMQTQARIKAAPQAGADVQKQVETANSQALGANILWGAGGVLAAVGVGMAVAF